MTITYVARHAGVSASAVPKVLREAYGVSDSMRVRVRAAMAEPGYRPHAAARGMRGRVEGRERSVRLCVSPRLMVRRTTGPPAA